MPCLTERKQQTRKRSSEVNVDIYTKRLGINRSYIIKSEGCIMIDTGPVRSAKAIRNWIKTIPIDPDEIRLILLSHAHGDHVGAARDVKEFTGAQIAIHEQDREYLEKSITLWPSALNTWGHIARIIMKPIKPILRFPATHADIVIEGDDFSLAEYGIPGHVVHTPGHTLGSVSVLLKTGDAFVGCLAHNNLPFRLRPGWPIFGEDKNKLQASWKRLLDLGAVRIHPGHGNPFSAEVIRQLLS